MAAHPHVGGVSGLLVQEGRVLLIRRAKEPWLDHWSLPGGGVEPGERLRDAVRREMREETGLDVEVGTVAGYREEFDGPAHYVILAFHVTADGAPVAGDDAAECEFVDPREAVSRKLTPGLTEVFVDAGLLDSDDLSGRDTHALPHPGRGRTSTRHPR